jgi:hypothetical protein
MRRQAFDEAHVGIIVGGIFAPDVGQFVREAVHPIHALLFCLGRDTHRTRGCPTEIGRTRRNGRVFWEG